MALELVKTGAIALDDEAIQIQFLDGATAQELVPTNLAGGI